MELSSVGINLNEVEMESREFKAIPNGKYTAILAAMECKTSKLGKQYLNAEFVISEGQYENTKLFEIFMLEGSDKSVSITKQRLKSLAIACHAPEADDTNDLIYQQQNVFNLNISASKNFITSNS